MVFSVFNGQKKGVYAFEKEKQGPKVDFIHMKGILCFVKESKSIWEVLWSDEGLYASEGVRNAFGRWLEGGSEGSC